MAKEKQRKEEDQPAGAPDWMVTFSDCMTLLLTFFVLMISYANFTPAKFRDTSKSISRELKEVRLTDTIIHDSMVTEQEEQKTLPTQNTNETPRNTHQRNSNAMRKKLPRSFDNMNVFSASSKLFFVANGKSLSGEGKELLTALAQFLMINPARIVISEFPSESDSDILGFKRAAVITKFLTQLGVEKKDISISATCLGSNTQDYRTVEITLLERSIYN